MSVWHSLAYSTYKFVGMIICLAMFMAGGKTSYYCTLAYTAAALSFFLVEKFIFEKFMYFQLRTVKNFVFDSNHFSGDDGRKRKLILILFILISQPLIMWWLTRLDFNSLRALLPKQLIIKNFHRALVLPYN